MPLVFFFFSPQSTFAPTKKSTYNKVTSFIKLRLFFHRVSSIINTFFMPLRETLYVGCVKLDTEVSQLFTHAAVFQLGVFRKTASFRKPKIWKGNELGL